MARDGSPTRTSATPQVFRQRSPQVLAAVCAVAGLLLLVPMVTRWSDDPQPLFVAWVFLGLAIVWSLFVRPAVLLDDSGVTVRNVVRDIHIPWALLTDVEFRWNLKVFAGDRGYVAWAISSQAGRPRRASGGGMLGSLLRGRSRNDPAGGRPAASSPKVTALMLAGLIEQAVDDHAEAVASRALPDAPDAQVQVIWVPKVLAILLVPAVAVVALTLI